MKKVKITIVGCGRIAQTHLQALEKIDRADLKAVCDVSSQTARSVAEQFKCQAYTDCRKMLASEEPDALIICSPPNTHSKISTLALTQGVNVLCEKPFALNSNEAKQMVLTAKKKKLLLMMASKFRFVDDVVRAKGMLQSGFLGKPVLFENIFCSRVDMSKRWNSRKRISGGGVLVDNGTHSVDIARFLLGPIAYVQAQFGFQIQDIAVEDTATLYLRSTGGVMGTVDLSWSINKEVDSYINIYGTEGTACIGWRESKYKLYEKDKWETFGKGYDKLESFLNQINHFIDCIIYRKKPIISALDGLESVRVIETAYWSSRVNKWMKVARE